jgi:hypothetical protein
LEQGEFYTFGPAFSQLASFIFAPTGSGPSIRALANAICLPPAPSKAIRNVLGKFGDLPHEVDVEIRSLDEARKRIADLEREDKRLRGSKVLPQIDQAGIERAIG